jgi:hypothetical protein
LVGAPVQNHEGISPAEVEIVDEQQPIEVATNIGPMLFNITTSQLHPRGKGI